MESTEYSSKINDLMTIKERKKLLRDIKESKKKLFYSNPQAITPFIRNKLADTLLRNSYPLIRRSPIVEETHGMPQIIEQDKEQYLALMKEQRSLIERELTALRLTEENNRKELEQSLKRLIESNGASNKVNVAEIRGMLKSFHEAQSDLQRDTQSTNPIIRDLKLLKTNYLLDGGNDPQLLADMDSVIRQAETNKTLKVNDNNAWANRRKDLVLARERSYELRDLERQNAELERHLEMSRVRSGVRSERKMTTWEKNTEHDKLEMLQKQIEALQQQIAGLQHSNNSDLTIPPMKTECPRTMSIKDTKLGIDTKNITILIDFVSGIGQYIRSVGIILSIYNGMDKIGNSLVVESLSVRPTDTIDLDSSALINFRHPVINCPVSSEVFALIELLVATELNNKPKVEGWAKLKLFNDHGELKLGKWNEFFLSSPVHVHATTDEILRFPRFHRSVLHYRLVLYSSDEGLHSGLAESDYDAPLPQVTKPNPFIVNHDARYFDGDSDNEKSDVTVDLDERPELGFQMIRVKNMTIGDGLELAKVRLTVYHTDGPKRGQVVMSTEGPVTCSTNAVRADFKIACYNFGRQLAKFTGVDLSVDCIVYGRFYLEGDKISREDGGVMEREERLLGWTAMPVVKRRTVARRNPSYFTDSLKLLRINRGIHDLSLYEPPALPPTMVFFDKNGSIVGQKVIGNTKLKFRLFHTQIVYDSATSSDNSSMDEAETTVLKTLKPWIPIDRQEPALMPYLQNDGFDLYIDSGRLLPDSVTIVKIEGTIVDRNLNPQGPLFSAISSMSSDIYNSIFNQRTEVREPRLSPSSTLLLKIMTFDREDKNLVVLGYSSLKLFVETGSSRQPQFDNLGVLASLNDGGHQVRIYQTQPTITGGPFTEDWFERNHSRYIPGASLLLRIFKPRKDANGKSISINEVPKNYQTRLGFIVPSPSYDNGYYFSMACKPTDGEHKIMTSHMLRPKVLLHDLLASKWADNLMTKVPLGESSENNSIYRLFDYVNKDNFNFNHVAHYVPTSGFKITIDCALNLPWSGYPMGHICIYPPGAIYMEKPLVAYDRPFFLSKLDLQSTQSMPVWLNECKSYRRRKYDRNLVAILHLHEMKINVVKNDYVFTLENQAWTPIRIFDGPYCITKSTQMPLITGSPTLFDLQELSKKTVQQFFVDNIASKKIILLQPSSVIVRQCDGRRHLELAVSAGNELLTLDQSNLPIANLAAYSTIISSNNDVHFNTMIPVAFTKENFQEFIRIKFKSLVYKLYEQGGFVLK